MGLLSSIGKIAGGALGFAIAGPAGAKIGKSLGGAAGGALDGKGESKGSSSSSQQAASGKVDISGLLEDSPDISSILGGSGETKIASVYEGLAGSKDPKLQAWAPTFEWYEDLGGDPSKTRPEVLVL